MHATLFSLSLFILLDDGIKDRLYLKNIYSVVKIDLVAKLFDEIAPKYVNRNGGYTRIVKIGQRKGDGALEVVLELV